MKEENTRKRIIDMALMLVLIALMIIFIFVAIDGTPVAKLKSISGLSYYFLILIGCTVFVIIFAYGIIDLHLNAKKSSTVIRAVFRVLGTIIVYSFFVGLLLAGLPYWSDLPYLFNPERIRLYTVDVSVESLIGTNARNAKATFYKQELTGTSDVGSDERETYLISYEDYNDLKDSDVEEVILYYLPHTKYAVTIEFSEDIGQ